MMWTAMMVAMMLPSLAPTLCRYREAVGRALAGGAYFVVWAVCGLAVYPVGVVLAALEMRYRALASAVPMAAGMVVLMAGALQFSRWKAHHLACCRHAPADAANAWRLGLRLGLHCICGCAGLTAILLVMGIMDWRAMAAITAAITAERVAPDGERVARVIGAVAAGAGLFLIARSAGLV
jgi:predicted metal-binding membrane protein